MAEMLGVIDWGIGGIGIARHLRAPVLYLSDTGVAPYGTLPRVQLAARLRRAVAELRARGAGEILLGCNAASTVLPLGVDGVRGVITATVDAVSRLRVKRVAVIGGKRTIRSRVYQTQLGARGIDAIGRIAQPLSGLIESGRHQSPAFEEAVRAVLSGIKNADGLLLACTHYPAANEIFRRLFIGKLIDPLPAIARTIRATGRGESQFLTTGSARDMENSARAAWGFELRAQAIKVR